MAFSDPVASGLNFIITQSGTDTDLSLLGDSSGVTKTYQGSKAHYHPGSAVEILITGTLTINPEENQLDFESNNLIRISSTGRLNLGTGIVSTNDGSTRNSVGVAITSTRAQKTWYAGDSGNGASIVVQSGGTLVAEGATTIFPGMFSFLAGSHIWIKEDGWEHFCYDYNTADGDIDPQTGVAVTQSTTTGVFTGLTGGRLGFGGGQATPNRGYLGWQLAGDTRVDGLTLRRGGEMVFARPYTAGNNTLSVTTNGYFGYSAESSKAPLLCDYQLANPLLGNSFMVQKNIRLFGLGNLKPGLALQSEGVNSGGTLGQAFLTNAYSGSEFLLGSDKLTTDSRNWGYATLGRDINVDIRDGLTGDTISGGAFFYRDYNTNSTLIKEYRLNLNGKDNLADKTFLSALTDSNLATDHEVILKIVNVVVSADKKGGTSNDIRGIDKSFDMTRTNSTSVTYDPTNFGAIETTDVVNIYVTPAIGATTHIAFNNPTAGQTLFTGVSNDFAVLPALPTDKIVFRIKKAYNTLFDGDLRTKSGIEGEDTFDFVFWHPEYSAATFIDFDLRDNTVGTRTLVANILPDPDYSNTSASNTTADTVDALYDHIKQRKSSATEALATGIEYPTVFTFAVERSNELLDIGSRTFETKTGTDQYELDDSSVKAHTTAFGIGTRFVGVVTTSSINLNNIVSSDGMILTAPTVTNLGTVGGTVNYTNNTTTSKDVSVLSTGIINSNNATTAVTGTFTSVTDDTGVEALVGATRGTYTVSGVISIGGKHSGVIISNATTGTNSVSGEVTGTLVTKSSDRLTVSGILGTSVTNVNGPITTTDTADTKALTIGDGDSNVGGTIFGNVLLGAGSSSVSGDITGKLTVGNGATNFSGSVSGLTILGTGVQTLSGTATGNLTTTGTISSTSGFTADGTVTSTATSGDNTVNGAIVGNVLLGNATAGHSVGANISAGTLTMGTGAHTVVSQTISGLVTTTGSITTGVGYNGGSTLTAGAGDSTIRGTSAGLVTLGDGDHTLNGTLNAGATLGDGTSTVSGTIIGSVTIGDGAHTLDGDITGDTTIGAGNNTLDGTIIGTVIVGAGNNTVSGTVTGDMTIGDGDNTLSGTLLGDNSTTIGTGDLTLGGDITGDLTTGDGNIGVQFGFTMNGTMNPGTGTVTFREDHDVSNIDLVALDGKDIIIVNQLESDFKNGSATLIGTGTITFPAALATRLDVDITGLPLGSHYVVVGENVPSSVTLPSGEIDGTESILRFSDTSNDNSDLTNNETRTHISSGLVGKWYIYYVDTNRSATFKGLEVIANTSATTTLGKTLTPTDFPIVFEASTVPITGRDLTVSSSDSTVQPSDKTTCEIAIGGVWTVKTTQPTTQATCEAADGNWTVRTTQPTTDATCTAAGGTWDSTAETCSLAGDCAIAGDCASATRPEFDLSGCPVRNWADEQQSSALVAKARNSVTYLNAMARQIAGTSGIDIPINNSAVRTFDVVRPVSNGADWREGRYLVKDAETGTQKVSGWYDVGDSSGFSRGLRTDRQLTDIASSVDSLEDGGDSQVQSQVRLVISSDDIAASTLTGLRDETNPINNVLGWIVGTNGTGSKLVGIKPRSEDYDSDTDYKPNT